MQAAALVGETVLKTFNPEFADVTAQYEFREAGKGDIPSICRLLFGWYGPSYPYPIKEFHPQGYYPVAIHRETGQLVGFAKAVPYKGGGCVYELGGLIVHPDHRENKVAKYLTRMRMAWVKQQNAAGVYSEPVCYREDCASQTNLIKVGGVITGIQPGKYPGLMRDVLGRQPETVLMYVRWLRGHTRLGHRTVFLPSYYDGILHAYLPKTVYERPWDETFPEIPMPAPVYHDGFTVQAGSGSELVDVPANWPETEDIIHALRQQGFRFCGVLPGFGRLADGRAYDYLRMYRLQARFIIEDGPFDFGKVHLVPQLGSLKQFCQSELLGEFPIE